MNLFLKFRAQGGTQTGPAPTGQVLLLFPFFCLLPYANVLVLFPVRAGRLFHAQPAFRPAPSRPHQQGESFGLPSQVPYDDVGGWRPSWSLVLWLLNPQRLYTTDRTHAESPGYQPFCYAYEGQGSRCTSLDRISLSTLGVDMTFLNNLGPSFNTLGQICQQHLKRKDIELWNTLPDCDFSGVFCCFFFTQFRPFCSEVNRADCWETTPMMMRSSSSAFALKHLISVRTFSVSRSDWQNVLAWRWHECLTECTTGEMWYFDWGCVRVLVEFFCQF